MLNTFTAATAPGATHPGDHLPIEAELLDPSRPSCLRPGPAWSKCMRAENHPSEWCGALGTDANGDPVVVAWRWVDRLPIPR